MRLTNHVQFQTKSARESTKKTLARVCTCCACGLPRPYPASPTKPSLVSGLDRTSPGVTSPEMLNRTCRSLGGGTCCLGASTSVPPAPPLHFVRSAPTWLGPPPGSTSIGTQAHTSSKRTVTCCDFSIDRSKFA